MIIAAFVLLLLVALGVLWLFVGAAGGPSIRIDAGPLDVMMSATSLFLFGAICALVVCLAIWMIRSGTARGLRHRRERKDLEQRADEAERERERALREKEAADTQAAKSRVAARDAELSQERATHPTPAADAQPQGRAAYGSTGAQGQQPAGGDGEFPPITRPGGSGSTPRDDLGDRGRN